MRIALVVPGGVGADGVHEVIPAVLSLVERLAIRNDVLVVATQQAAAQPHYELAGARVIALGSRRPPPFARVVLAWRAFGEIRAFRPDVVHAIWLGPGSSIAVAAGRRLGVPVVASLGGGELVALPRIGYGGARSLQGRTHAWIALRAAAAVTAGSRSALEPMRRRRSDARWLPLGADRRADPDLVASRAADDRLRLVVAASVNRVKGPEVVLGALVRVRAELGDRVHLDWIGQDTLDGRAASLARALGVSDAVAWHGFRPHARVLDTWGSADLAIQGSHHESQGVAILEAAMAGIPTVGTAVGLVAELAAADPPAAIAVAAGDPRALAEGIVAVALDADRRRSLGAAARAWAEAHDADWTAAAFEALYAEALSNA